MTISSMVERSAVNRDVPSSNQRRNNMKKYVTYLAGWIEACPTSANSWREEINKAFEDSNIFTYCPIKYESVKTGQNFKDNVKYIRRIKKERNWKKFKTVMKNIWWGKSKVLHAYPLLNLTGSFYKRNFNHRVDLTVLGEFEAVVRSDFIIVNYHHSKPSWGTPAEALLAYLFNIPIYVISNVSKVEMNSTLLWWVEESNGQIFYKNKSLINFIKKLYKVNKYKV